MKTLVLLASLCFLSMNGNCNSIVEVGTPPPPSGCLLLRSPLVGDFNHDEYPDIAYYGKCGNGASDCWRVHLNNKNGQFTTTSYGADMWFKSSDLRSIPVVGDFNNDGYSDIAYFGRCGNGEDCWRVHLNNKNGQFTTTSYGGGIWFAGSSPIHIPMAGDFNGDGYTDIAYYGKVGNGADCWRIHLNNKNGQFTTTSYGADMWFKSSDYGSMPMVGDFNKDSYSDIAYYGACGNGADCWRVHLNNKNGQFTTTSYGAEMWFAGSSPIHAPMAGDFNGDGYTDIAYYGKVGNGADCWRVHLNNKSGQFTTTSYGADMWFKSSNSTSKPVVADFNKDGYSDIAYYGACGNGADCWRVHLNNKNGQFTTTSYGGDMWFGDCEDVECKTNLIQSDVQIATGPIASFSRAEKKAIEDWEKKAKNLYGKKYANWKDAKDKDIKGSTQYVGGWARYKSEVYCYGEPCGKSPKW